MEISVTGRSIEVTPALRRRVEKKMKRLAKHYDHLIDVSVVLDVNRHEQLAEATVNASGKTFFADASSDDLYVAIDLLSDRLDRQILKFKDKMRDHSGDDSIRRDVA
ncbi:MAG: ribosome-associated translation inhibitor RaiA [Pseudomonadota bacterium]